MHVYCHEHKGEVVSFLGPPGSGKGTIAQKWQEHEGVVVLSTGALCREHISQETPLGKELNEYISRGELVPDTLISKMVKQWLADHKEHNDTILLDGYPRTARQVHDWIEIMAEVVPTYRPRVILFSLSQKVVLDRLVHRLVCANNDCQKVYSDKLFAGSPTVCPVCGAQLMRRHDDQAKIIAQRLRVYERNKNELLTAYRARGIAVEVFDVESISLHEMFTQFSELLHRRQSSV